MPRSPHHPYCVKVFVRRGETSVPAEHFATIDRHGFSVEEVNEAMVRVYARREEFLRNLAEHYSKAVSLVGTASMEVETLTEDGVTETIHTMIEGVDPRLRQERPNGDGIHVEQFGVDCGGFGKGSYAGLVQSGERSVGFRADGIRVDQCRMRFHVRLRAVK
jgi:hypothetical protein